MFKFKGQTNSNNDKNSFFEVFKRINTRDNYRRLDEIEDDQENKFKIKLQKNQIDLVKNSDEFNFLEIRSNVTIKSPKKIGRWILIS